MEITKIQNVILSKKTVSGSKEDITSGKYRSLVEKMRVAMKEYSGVGLAANQIGHDISIFIIDEKTAKAYEKPDVYINPEITEHSDDTDEMEEGCLSLPQCYVLISRAKKIKIKAITLDGQKVKFKARGFLARVLQHETDHLNGILIKEQAGR